MVTALRYSERRVLEFLVDDDRRFITLELLYAELRNLTVRQIQGALSSLKRLGFVTGRVSYAATGVGAATLAEILEAEETIT